MNIISRIFLSCLALSISAEVISAAGSRHLLYVASPGIRNYLEYGGVGILVFDVDDGYKFVRRIPTWSVPEGKKVVNRLRSVLGDKGTSRRYIETVPRKGYRFIEPVTTTRPEARSANEPHHWGRRLIRYAVIAMLAAIVAILFVHTRTTSLFRLTARRHHEPRTRNKTEFPFSRLLGWRGTHPR